MPGMNLISKVKRRITKLIPPYGEILMLHNVVEKRSLLEDNRKIEITPAFLEQTILKYKDAGYSFVSLDEVQRQVVSKKRGEHKFACFTLDDGYANSYETAYPIFKKHNCPFAIYVTTDFPDNKAKLWWYLLEDILLRNETLQLNGVEYDCSDFGKKNQAFKAIRGRIFNPETEIILNTLEQLYKENDGSAYRVVKTLSWEQISELASDPLCTIGAHTVSHASLPSLSDEEIRNELSEGKKKLEDRIKKPVKHFAYPFGNWDDRVASLVMEQYDTAVLVWSGFIRRGDTLDRLKRNELIEEPLIIDDTRTI